MRTYVELPAGHAEFACVWSSTSTAGEPAKRVVPDGCADVIWHRESGHLMVAGPDTRVHETHLVPGTVVAVRFRPGRAPGGLGMPADALRDARPVLADVWEPARAARLAEALAKTGSVADAGRLLAATVADTHAPTDPAVPTLLSMCQRGDRVSTIAAGVGLTERQLHRRCLAAFGYGAKVLHRVLRFDGALRMAWSGRQLTEIAYELGYADQAHLSREVKAFAGVPMTQLL